MIKVVREQKATQQASATAAGQTNRQVLQAIGAVSLADCQLITLNLNVTQGMVGTNPTFDVYVQRAIRANPDITNNAHWEDVYHFTQITTGTLNESVDLPIMPNVGTVSEASAGTAVKQAQLAAATARVGEIYDVLRIAEVVSGTGISQAALYDLHITGQTGPG